MYGNAPPLQAPLQQAPMVRDGLAALEAVPGVLVRQKLQLLEEFCACFERRNRYKISAIPPGLGDRNPTDVEFDALPSFMEARESSTCCCRFCCANRREFTMGFFPGGTPDKPHWPVAEAPMLSIHRPFKCTLFCCCCLLFPQELSVSTHAGQHIGRVVEDFRCVEACCKCNCWSKGYDRSGNHIYSFKAPLCCEGNCCAPTCCNPVFKISVRDAKNESKILSFIKNVWPGWNFRGLCSANVDNYVVNFPEGATKEEKALVMGGLFFHDFMFFEKTDDNNN